MQHDIVLRLPMCSLQQISACESPASTIKAMKPGSHKEFNTVVEDGAERPLLLCELVVPGACPRVTCFSQEKKAFDPCRLQAGIQSQKNESGFWMKLPCSMCSETRKLSAVTEAFVHGEDTGGN